MEIIDKIICPHCRKGVISGDDNYSYCPLCESPFDIPTFKAGMIAAAEIADEEKNRYPYEDIYEDACLTIYEKIIKAIS